MYSKTVPPTTGAGKRRSAARRYLKQVRKRLACSYRMKKPFLSQLEKALFLFTAETENAGWDALVAQFGTPENAADEFMSGLEPAALWKYRRGKIHLMLAVVCVAAALIFTMWIHSYFESLAFMDGYWMERIVADPNVPTAPTNPPLWSETLPVIEP